MDKNQYIDKYIALLNDTKVYKPCKNTTKKIPQTCPGIPLKAQQVTQDFKTIWLEQALLQQIAPHR